MPLMLLLGGLIIPVAGWILAILLLWRSPSWTRSDKLLGTFAVPGGILPFAWLATEAVAPSSADGLSDVVTLVAGVVLLTVPSLTAAYLYKSLYRATPGHGGHPDTTDQAVDVR